MKGKNGKDLEQEGVRMKMGSEREKKDKREHRDKKEAITYEELISTEADQVGLQLKTGVTIASNMRIVRLLSFAGCSTKRWKFFV